MSMSKEKCGDCRFWDESGYNTAGQGRCKINPPTIDSDDGRGRWPRTLEDDWCGKFEAKKAAPK